MMKSVVRGILDQRSGILRGFGFLLGVANRCCNDDKSGGLGFNINDWEGSMVNRLGKFIVVEELCVVDDGLLTEDRVLGYFILLSFYPL